MNEKNYIDLGTYSIKLIKGKIDEHPVGEMVHGLIDNNEDVYKIFITDIEPHGFRWSYADRDLTGCLNFLTHIISSEIESPLNKEFFMKLIDEKHRKSHD